MKTKSLWLTLAAVGTILAGCEGDDDGIGVDGAMNRALQSRYPGATGVQWERNNDYYVADFRRNGVECEAWFDGLTVWYMTETDVRWADLPQAVRTAFEQCDYASWRIEDIDMLEYPDRETVYIFETEQGNAECDLWFTADGVLAKTLLEGAGTGSGETPGGDNGGTHQPSTVLPAVKEFIAGKYPQARIVDVDTERSTIEVDIVDGRTPREVVFTLTGEWICTETDVRRTDLPQAVASAFGQSEYASWHVDDIDMMEYPDRETVYILEVEQGKVERDLWFTPDGVLAKTYPEDTGSGGGGTGNDTPGNTPDDNNPGNGNGGGDNPGNGNGGGNTPGNGNGSGGGSGHPSVVPSAVWEFITANYPQARLVDVDIERNTIEVDIVDDRTPREVVFTLTAEWIHTETEVRQADVPAVVLNAVRASQYGSWHIDDVDHYATPTGEYYRFELESGHSEKHLKITPDGTVLP